MMKRKRRHLNTIQVEMFCGLMIRKERKMELNENNEVVITRPLSEVVAENEQQLNEINTQIESLRADAQAIIDGLKELFQNEK